MARPILCSLGFALIAPFASAQPIDVTLPTTADRWFYPFNGTPGFRADASTFGAIGLPDFDDRDAQILIQFDTSGAITAGLGATAYRVLSARVTATVSRDLAFTYDPTFDALDTYTGDAIDTDAGRPIELFPVGFRNGSTFSETLPFNVGAPFPVPNAGLRNAFVCDFDALGVAFDLSNNVRDGLEAPSYAIGQDLNPDLAMRVPAGAPVPLDTEFTFEIDLTNPSAVGYIRDQLDEGALLVGLSALAQVAGQGDPSSPAFYMRENPFGTPASLELSVCTGSPADWDCSGDVSVLDLLDFLSLWFAGNVDFNLDGTTDVLDLLDFLAVWFEG